MRLKSGVATFSEDKIVGWSLLPLLPPIERDPFLESIGLFGSAHHSAGVFVSDMTMLFLAALVALATVASGLLELPISRRDESSHMPADVLARSLSLEKRDVGTNVYDIYSWSYAGGYYTNITVGTPPQLINVIVTGTADTYFDVFCPLPYTDPNSCRGGTFDPSQSKTFRPLSNTFNITFVDQSKISGPYGIDVVGIGNVQVAGTQFGVAQQLTSDAGYAVSVMGLGYSSTESLQNSSLIYPNLPEALVHSGVANSRVYALELGSGTTTGSGSVLFGAIDNSKYTGELATMNMLPSSYNGRIQSTIDDFIVPLTAVSIHTSRSSSTLFSGGSDSISAYNSSSALPVSLSSGSLIWYLPSHLINTYILPALPFIDENGTSACSNAATQDYFSLTFGGKVPIRVNVSELLMPVIDQTTRQPVIYNNTMNETTCFFAVYPEDNVDFWTMGMAALRSMYAVFDLDNGQISIAQAIANVTAQTRIVEVKAGANGVASAAGPSGVPEGTNPYSVPSMATRSAAPINASTISPPIGTATGLAAIPISAQVSSSAIAAVVSVPSPLAGNSTTPTGTSSPTYVPPPPNNHAGAIAGGVVGGVVGLALIVGAVYFFLRRRKANARREPMQEVQTDWTGSPDVDESVFTVNPRLGEK